MPTPRRKTLTAATAAALALAAAALLSARRAQSPAETSHTFPPSSTTTISEKPRAANTATRTRPRHDPSATLTQPTPLDDPQLLANFHALAFSPGSDDEQENTRALARLFTPLAHRGCWDAALDLLATTPDLPAGRRADILHTFYRTASVPPAILLAQLPRLTTAAERQSTLDGYLRARDSSMADHLGSEPMEQTIRSRFTRTGALLDPANFPGGPSPLTDEEHRTLLTRLAASLSSDLFFNQVIRRNEIEPSFTAAFSGLDSLAPLLQPGEETTLREALAIQLCSTRPFDSWDMLAASPTLAPTAAACQFRSMLEQDNPRALAAARCATATQLDSLYTACTDPTVTWSPPDQREDIATSRDGSDGPLLRLPPAQLNAAATAFLEAALNLHDPVRARQWLAQITDPAAHAAAEKKLQQ